MCGIAGIIGTSKSKAQLARTLSNMLSMIAHRGPDGKGIWQTDPGNVHFGHQRLSIIDLNENANQPMLNNGYSVVFNGEIYNHRELRVELEAAGVKFKTEHSDTEVLINGFIYWGIETLLGKINGMFAFAIYDLANEQVIICRDRVGIKNIYYSKYHGDFLFSSEIKGILGAEYFKPEFDSSCLNEYLLNRSLVAPRTLFRHIRKIAPATYITIDLISGKRTETQYWDPLEVKEDNSIQSHTDMEQGLLNLISSSIDYRLEADVPVGMFLSGGVDSNYLLSCLAQKRKGIKCFNASFHSDGKYDESSDAKMMADKFEADFVDVPVNANNYNDILTDVIYYQEEPIAAPVCVPVYMLSQAARANDVPVILSGEGADEVLIGYENWLKIRTTQKWVRKIPLIKPLATVGKLVASKVLNVTSPTHDILDRASKGLPLFWGGAMDMNYLMREQLLEGVKFDTSNNDQKLGDAISCKRKTFIAKRAQNDDSAWMTYLDLQHRLPELMLPRLDKMGMAHSIEGRVPFLDHRIIEFIFSVPESIMNERSNVGKSGLKAIAAKTLGHDFVYRRKKGFQAPVNDWKDGLFSHWVEYLKLFSERTGIFNLNGVDNIVEFGGRRYFTLVNFMIWYLIYIDNVLSDKMPELKRWDQF